MTIEELAAILPNGFHDARLKRLEVNYELNSVQFYLELWTGDLDASDEAKRERYTPCQLTLRGLVFCIIEPPIYSAYEAGDLRIDIHALADVKKPLKTKIPERPDGVHASMIFVTDWNACMYVAYRDAQIIVQ
jgi:hypothetical protein